MEERKNAILNMLRKWIEEYICKTETVEQGGVTFLQMSPALYEDNLGHVLMEVCLLEYSDATMIGQIYSTLLPQLGAGEETLRRKVGEWNLVSLAGAYGIYEKQGHLYHKHNVALINDAAVDDQVDFLFNGLCLALDEMGRRLSDAVSISRNG